MQRAALVAIAEVFPFLCFLDTRSRAKEEHDVAVANEETNVHALVALEEAESSYSQRIEELEKEMESLQTSVVQVRKHAVAAASVF